MIVGRAVSGALAARGRRAPLYLAGALAAAAALLVWKSLPNMPRPERQNRDSPQRMRILDVRIRRFALTAVALFTGFSAIQQTLGFQIQDQLSLSGVKTAQYTGAALMVSAIFTFAVQVSVMQRVKLPPHIFVRTGLAFLAAGSLLIAGFEHFPMLAVGMALLGTGLGLTMPAIVAGASLAVSSQEQGSAAGVISACPAVGFVCGPVIGGLLYPLAPFGPALFSALIFSGTIIFLYATSKR